MGVIKDIVDFSKDIFRKTSDIEDKISKVNKKSFARGANEQIFPFPCLISESIPIDMATTITKNLDLVYASFTQIYLSANGVIDLNYIKNPRQFVQQYRSNFSLESADYTEEEMNLLESVQDYYKDFYNGEPKLYLNNDGKGFLFTASESVSPYFMSKFKESMKESLSLYNTNSLYMEGKKRDEFKDAMLNSFLDQEEDKKQKDEDRDAINASKNEQTPRMVERDVKKLNDMQPYAMDLKILATKGDTSFSQYMTFTVGVKTTCHLAKSKSLIINLVHVLKNRNFLFNFIRWTTGELSLMKDIILQLNEANFNVANRSDRTGRMISKLKELKKKKVKVSASGLSRVAPFATIVISNYEYDEILNNYGFDLKNITYAKKVMDELFLMCFIIVDESTQTIDMLLDGSQTGFQTYSLDTLQREVNMRSSKLSQELSRMLGGSN